MHIDSNRHARKIGAYAVAAGATVLGIGTVAQAGLNVYDYRDTPLGAGVEDNYSVFDHDMAVLYTDGTYKRSTHNGTDYVFYDQNGVTTEITEADKSGDAVWITHHGFLADSGFGSDKGFDGSFLYSGNGGTAANLINGSVNGSPLYEVYHDHSDGDVGVEFHASQIDSSLNYSSGGAVIRGVGGQSSSPGWGGSSVYGDRKGFLGRGFVGFFIDEADGRHFGWVEVGTDYRPYGVTIYGWAYETTPWLAADISYDVVVPLAGDFDNDGDVDADDIDLLFDNLGGVDMAFDLNSDGLVDQADVDEWVLNTVPVGENVGTVFGDFNLDGAVDAGDLALLGGSFGQAGDFGWAEGDATGDGVVDAGDLALLGGNFGTIVHPVPEPMTLGLLAMGGVGILNRRRK